MSSPAPFGFLPPGALSGLRRSVIDPETGNPVVTSTPTGDVVQRSALLPIGRDDSGALVPAVPGMLTGMADAAAYPGQVARGEASIRGADGRISDEAVGKAFDLAGTAMTGSLPFGAPKGALRMFGGIGKDDPLAALEAGLADLKPAAPSPRPRLMDPSAKSWDLYHGSNAGPDFKRFDPHAGDNPAEHGGVFFAPDPETASGYAATGSARAGDAGQRVFRATVEPGKTDVFDISHLAETDPAFNARAREITVADGGERHGPLWDQHMENYRANRAQDADIAQQIVEMGFTPDPNAATRMSFGHGHIAAALERAKAQGLDTAILRGLVEHGGDDQVVALTPGRVRSFYAPDQLLYSGGPGGAGVGAAVLSASGNTPTSDSPATGSKGQPMTSGIPFGFGFGAMPLPNADPNDPRLLLQRLPFDPTQAPGVSPAADTTGPAGALVHHPGWSASGVGGGQGPGVAMDEADTQRLEAQTRMMPGGTGGQSGQQGRYPGLAELFDRAPMSTPQAFEGTSGTIVPGQAPASRTVPLPPQRPDDLSVDAAPEPPPTRYTALGGGAPAARTAAPVATGQADAPAPAAVPTTGRIPFGFGGPAPGATPSATPTPSGAAGQGTPGAAAEPSFGDKVSSGIGHFVDNGGGDLMTSLGIGLLTTPGWGQALGAGLKNYQSVSEKKSATDLARQEFGLRLQKAAQEATGLKGNQAFIKAAFPNLPADQVAAGASNSTLVSAAIAKMQNPNAGREMKPDSSGVNRWVDTGQPVFKDDEGKSDAQLVDVPIGGGQTQKQWVKKGEATGPSVGQPSPPDKPQTFDVETKLRGEFAKGLGSFSDVHDGYGRVIAATRQREASPDGKSPAADISLIFGYMKMLDPGSVVREGEYATAGNAGGLDDRMRNTYNKLLNGESLTPAQRQDFLGQASELYGTARKNAEAVAGRYRNLAGQYKVDPDRSVYLPEVPTAPTVGPNRMKPTQGQAPGSPAGTSRSDLEAEARRRGLVR